MTFAWGLQHNPESQLRAPDSVPSATLPGKGPHATRPHTLGQARSHRPAPKPRSPLSLPEGVVRSQTSRAGEMGQHTVAALWLHVTANRLQKHASREAEDERDTRTDKTGTLGPFKLQLPWVPTGQGPQKRDFPTHCKKSELFPQICLF